MTIMDAHRHLGNKNGRSNSIYDHKTDDLRPQNTTFNTVIPVYMHISYFRLPKGRVLNREQMLSVALIQAAGSEKSPHCKKKKKRRFYGKIPGIWLPVLLPLF